MRILAIGGAGYVGSATVRELIKQDFEVWVYDNLCRGHRDSVPPDILIEGELADDQHLINVMRDKHIDAVMHFAAFALVGESTQQPLLYYRNNVANSLTLLEAMRRAGVEKLLFSSTSAVYKTQSDTLMTEGSEKAPENPYAFSKLAIEQMMEDCRRAYGLGYTILRYFNACGGSDHGRYGEDHDPETHLIPLVLQVPLGQRDFIGIFGDDYATPDGTGIRDYIHVDDLARAHVLAVRQVQPGSADIYNVGTGQGHSVLEVIETAERIVGEKIEKRTLPRRPGDADRLVAAADKIKQQLGWHAEIDHLEAIIETAWQWHKTHPQGYADKATVT